MQRRSGRLPPRPPGPLRVWELCLGTASGDGSPFLGCCIGGESPLLVSSFPFLLRAERRVFSYACMCVWGVCLCGTAKGGGAQGRGPTRNGQSQWLVALERGRGDGRSARGSRRQQGVRGSRHFLASALARAGLSRKVRNAGQRGAQLQPPIRVCSAPFLSSGCSILPSPSDLARARRGGGARGCGVRCGAGACVSCGYCKSK